MLSTTRFCSKLISKLNNSQAACCFSTTGLGRKIYAAVLAVIGGLVIGGLVTGGLVTGGFARQRKKRYNQLPTTT